MSFKIYFKVYVPGFPSITEQTVFININFQVGSAAQQKELATSFSCTMSWPAQTYTVATPEVLLAVPTACVGNAGAIV
jgi:hypothetical protein